MQIHSILITNHRFCGHNWYQVSGLLRRLSSKPLLVKEASPLQLNNLAEIFTSFMLKHVPDITQQQIGALWWRADTNNDGQVGESSVPLRSLGF